MSNEPSKLPAPPKQTPPKVRHGCLTVWLIFIIIGNVMTSVLLLNVSAAEANIAGWVKGLDIGLSLWIAICAGALFLWKKWGFYGFVLAAVISIALNVALKQYLYILSPVISVAILYGILQIGGANRGWTQLE